MLLTFTDIHSILSGLLDLFPDPVTLNNCFYCATMYLPIETECYSVDHRKSCQRVESWKLSRPSAGRGLPGAGSLHRIHRYRGDRIYDDCAADHVILPSFCW